MKNALILHGTSGSPEANWFPWLKEQLENSGYNVWVPQLPNADYPDMNAYREFIFGGDFNFNEDTIIIGHSSGAVATLSILEALSEKLQVDTAIMVGVYRPEKRDFSTKDPIEVSKLKGKARHFVFVHSDNDPYCPLEDAEYYAKELDAELAILPGEDHFSLKFNPKHTKLPELLKVLDIEEASR